MMNKNTQKNTNIVVGKWLTDYVERINVIREIDKKPKIDFNSNLDKKEVAESLNCDFSPENVSADGERSHSEINARLRYLNAVYKDLIAIDASLEIYLDEVY